MYLTSKKSLLFTAMLIISAAITYAKESRSTSITELRVEYLHNPVGIDIKKPRFSWRIESTRPGIMQSHYRIIVTSDKDNPAIIWDSGKVESGLSVHIPYNGPQLQPFTRYHWTVTVWDNHGNQITTANRTDSYFETGLLNTGWSGAQWIKLAGNNLRKDAVLLFRSEFNIKKEIETARIYSTALGIYDLFINNKRIGSISDNGKTTYDELKPGWTNYSKTLFYNTYDITPFLNKGGNAIGAAVSSGWWAGDIAHGEYGNPDLGFLALLRIKYTDGTIEYITTHPDTWKSNDNGAITSADIYAGECYDARLESGWSSFGYDDTNWKRTEINHDFQGKIISFIGPGVQVRPELERLPISCIKYNGSTPDANGFGTIDTVKIYNGKKAVNLTKGDTVVYDMGQNMVGWIKFKVKGKRGTRVTFRFSEMLNDNGSISRGNDGPGGSLYRTILRTAKATLQYTLKGTPDGEIFRPSMTFFGFRYCDVSVTDDLSIESLKGEVVGTVNKEGSHFVTNNDAVNKLCRNILWGQRGNFLSVPTDCPQRDERLGWTGDILAFCRAATYNADVNGFFCKWLGDVRDGQREDGAFYDLAPRVWGNEVGNAAWAEAALVVAWNTYLMYGDLRIIEENYDAMERFMQQRATQVFDGYKYNGGGITHGDWLAPEGNEPEKKRYIAVCFYAYSARLMQKMSEIMAKYHGKKYEQKALEYKILYNNIKNEFQTRYINSDGALTQDGQTTYLLALKLDLFPDTQSVNKAITHLDNLIKSNDNRLGTGFVGTAIINQTLSEYGLSETAYNLLLQRKNPSWLYSVDQGATTIWERWNGYTYESGFHPQTSMNSFNHYAYGAVLEWMFRYMAGINPDKNNPGFKHIILSPHIDLRNIIPAGQKRITYVDASYESHYGKISSSWKINEKKDNIKYDFTIPANTTATVILHLQDKYNKIKCNQRSLNKVSGIISHKTDDTRFIINLLPGKYSFTIGK